MEIGSANWIENKITNHAGEDNVGDDDNVDGGDDDVDAGDGGDAPLKRLQSYVSPLLSLPTRFNWQLWAFSNLNIKTRMRIMVKIILKAGDLRRHWKHTVEKSQTNAINDPVQLAAQSFSNLHQNEDEGDGENCIESYWWLWLKYNV